MLRLIGTDHNRYYSWELKPGKYIIGRKSDCDFVINDGTISRHHAELEVSDDFQSLDLTDLGSRNGTAVNSRQISGHVALKIDDHINFGQTEFKVSSGDSAFTEAGQQLTPLADFAPEQSVVIPMAEALKPLPARIADRQELIPTLFDMAKMLVLPEPKEIMLKRSLELVSKIIPADRLAVLFTSEDQQEIYTVATLLPGGKDLGKFTLSRTIINNLLDEKKAILISDAREDPRFASQESIIMSELKSAMAVPLFDEDKVLGILYADTTNPMHSYNDDYLRLFATIGNIIASRLVNFVLLQERQQKQIYESELRRATQIQSDLLPREIPQIEGYDIYAVQEQCRAVGGDLYDLHRLPDGKLLFMVADVSGKGLGAALLMSNILASFRILYDDERIDLNRLVNQVSLQLYKYTSSSLFATLFIGLLDPIRHQLNFINAGHNPPMLFRQDGGLKHLEPSGTMIGAFDFCSWSEDSSEFGVGDQLIIYTDGVTEAGIEDEEYSDQRLEKLVVDNNKDNPKNLAQKIMNDIDNFTGNADQSDDITMVIIKRVT
jgi:sigma-B regulation protein RsbU (phosphoserine phosphatase)